MHSGFQILWPLASRVYGGSQFFGGCVAVAVGGGCTTVVVPPE
jgi:hypothetical protein